MSHRVHVIEWTDKDGRVYRTAPIVDVTDEWMKAGVRQASAAMCKPVLRTYETNEDDSWTTTVRFPVPGTE